MKLNFMRAALAAFTIALSIAPLATTLHAQSDSSFDAAPSGYLFSTGRDGVGECIPIDIPSDC